MNKASARKAINEYLTIVVGCLIVSVGFVFFINPYKFVPGGVFGTSIVLQLYDKHPTAAAVVFPAGQGTRGEDPLRHTCDTLLHESHL